MHLVFHCFDVEVIIQLRRILYLYINEHIIKACHKLVVLLDSSKFISNLDIDTAD